MRNMVVAAVIAVLGTTTAFGQPASRFYAGATGSGHQVQADDVSGGIGALGGLAGFRLTQSFSIEAEANHGFGDMSRRQTGTFISFAAPGASREEIERLGVTMQSDTRWTPGFGWSLLAVWGSRPAGRVGAAVFGGITSRRYEVRRMMTALNIPAGVNYTEADLHRMMPDEQGTRTRGGITGGVLFPVRLTPQFSVAPEIRYTYGSFGDERYSAFRAGARVMWGF